MNEKLGTCPFCDGTRITATAWYADTRLPGAAKPKTSQADFCPKCGRPLTEEAVNAANDPLTLDELREMDGEPVWVTPLGFWALVIVDPGECIRLICNDGETVCADKEIELVGPIYRRPPEGGLSSPGET